MIWQWGQPPWSSQKQWILTRRVEDSTSRRPAHHHAVSPRLYLRESKGCWVCPRLKSCRRRWRQRTSKVGRKGSSTAEGWGLNVGGPEHLGDNQKINMSLATSLNENHKICFPFCWLLFFAAFSYSPDIDQRHKRNQLPACRKKWSLGISFPLILKPKSVGIMSAYEYPVWNWFICVGLGGSVEKLYWASDLFSWGLSFMSSRF